LTLVLQKSVNFFCNCLHATFTHSFTSYFDINLEQKALLLRWPRNLQAIVVLNNGVAPCNARQVMPPGKWKMKISQYTAQCKRWNLSAWGKIRTEACICGHKSYMMRSRFFGLHFYRRQYGLSSTTLTQFTHKSHRTQRDNAKTAITLFKVIQDLQYLVPIESPYTTSY